MNKSKILNSNNHFFCVEHNKLYRFDHFGIKRNCVPRKVEKKDLKYLNCKNENLLTPPFHICKEGYAKLKRGIRNDEFKEKKSVHSNFVSIISHE
jgi:hypothetical protein